VKNSFSTVKSKNISGQAADNEGTKKSTNINVLLNRVRIDQKNEKRKKILFSASASLGLILFGIIIF
tara:strand:+ start:399 stop:599 length:201 start_codon:yes stop_codon:yes gene_type:complete